MDFIYIGKIVNTHGIKGEIRIISYFEYKDKVFIPNQNIYIGKDKKRYKIVSYRRHKNYDMVILEGYNDINQVLPLIKQEVYINKEDLSLNDGEYCYDDIIGYDVCTDNQKKGIVSDIYLIDSTRRLMDVKMPDKTVMVPVHPDFIKEVDKNKKVVILTAPEGMFE